MANRAQLEKEIKEYCNLNGITDIPGFITQCLLKGFNIFRYGTSPADNVKRQRGEIIDSGSNRKKKETVEDKKQETSQESVIVRKKRTIKITNTTKEDND